MSQIETYITANAEYEQAKQALGFVAELVRQSGVALLQNPERFYFTNAAGEGLPTDIALNRASKSVDAADWPTPEKLHTLIMRRFNAKRAVEEAWHALPSNMRSSLVPPKL